MATRQTRRARSRQRVSSQGGIPTPGLTVDAYGSEAVDPTENVLALVDAQARFQEKFDELTAKYTEVQIRHVHAIIEAERRRVDNLADMKKGYDNQIGESQAGQMKSTSDLVSTQLDKVTNSLSDTINKTADNIAATLATIDKRLAGVEQFRYETGGRSSVSDPAMLQIVADLKTLSAVSKQGEGRHEQSTDTRAMIFAILGILFGGGLVSAIIAILERHG